MNKDTSKFVGDNIEYKHCWSTSNMHMDKIKFASRHEATKNILLQKMALPLFVKLYTENCIDQYLHEKDICIDYILYITAHNIYIKQ